MKPTCRIGTFGVAGGMIVAAAVAAQLAGFAPRGSRAEQSEGVLITTLVGRDARVGVMATAAGTRYEIRSHDGRLLATNLSAADVAQLLPGQDPRGTFAEEPAGERLMLAEPRQFERD